MALSWLAATTHLSTLIVLREYFYANPVVRNWRILGIVTFLILLTFFQIVSVISDGAEDTIDIATPIQCIIDGRTRGREYSPLRVALGTYALVFFLLPQYIGRTIALFCNPEAVGNTGGLYYASNYAGRLRKAECCDQQQLLDNARIQQHALRRRDAIVIPFGGSFVRHYMASFLSDLPFILYFLFSGLSDSTVVTWFYGVDTTGDHSRFGFGQVVPLALLIIPILTASEIYNAELAPVSAKYC
jgi:hypothetical protein